MTALSSMCRALAGFLALGALLAACQTKAVVPSPIGSLHSPEASVVAPSPSPVVTPSPSPVVTNRIGVLAILRESDHGGRLWLTSFDGTAARELFPGRPERQDGLAWSPDGTRLIFSESIDRLVSNPHNETIYLSDAAGSTPQIVHTRCEPPCGDDHFPSFSSDGTQIVFNRTVVDASGDAGSLIATMDLASGRVVELDSTLFIDSYGSPWHERPRWSPDGRQIVYSRWHFAQGGSGFFIVDADGSNLHEVDTDGLGARDPEWSPDGSRIVFSSIDAVHGGTDTHQLTFDVYTIRADGTDLRRLTTDNISSGATWTGDGRILLTKTPGGGKTVPGEALSPAPLVTEIWIMDADGTRAAQLAELPPNQPQVERTRIPKEYTSFFDQTALQPTP